MALFKAFAYPTFRAGQRGLDNQSWTTSANDAKAGEQSIFSEIYIHNTYVWNNAVRNLNYKIAFWTRKRGM